VGSACSFLPQATRRKSPATAACARYRIQQIYVKPQKKQVPLRTLFFPYLRGMGALVGVIMGSVSDAEVMAGARRVLEEFGVAYEFTIVSAHRTPDRLWAYARQAAARGLRVIIAGAGGAAHLPGMVASLTHLPVIGVPIRSRHSLAGLDSLLSIVQMPKGVPVATVAIDNAANAALLAVRILALQDEGLQARLIAHQERLRHEALEPLLREPGQFDNIVL